MTRAAFILLATVGIASVAAAQVSEGTPQLSSGPGTSLSDLYNNGVPALTSELTKDKYGAAAGEYARAATQDAKNFNNSAKWFTANMNNPKLPPGMKEEAQAAAGAAKADARASLQQGKWARSIGTALDVLDWWSVAVEASAYAVEGDTTGASAVIAKQLTKKLIQMGAMAGLSWMPGGQAVGAVGGEAFAKEYINPVIDQNEQNLRDAAWDAKYKDMSWLPVVRVMDANGNVRTLAPNQYYDRDSGLIKERSPEEQKAYEYSTRLEWSNSQKLGQVMKDLADGKISKERYDELMDAYRSRDFTKPWRPELVPEGAARFAGTYTGHFDGGGSGSIKFTISGHIVQGTLSGVCTTSPCQSDPVSGSFMGSISDSGEIATQLSGSFNIKSNFIGVVTFGGVLNGKADGEGGAQGLWAGRNKWGTPTGSWSASKFRQF